jgi:hypothetical protein
MKRVALILTVALSTLSAHDARTDTNGCHMDYSKSNYHCHKVDNQPLNSDSDSISMKKKIKETTEATKQTASHDHS